MAITVATTPPSESLLALHADLDLNGATLPPTSQSLEVDNSTSSNLSTHISLPLPSTTTSTPTTSTGAAFQPQYHPESPHTSIVSPETSLRTQAHECRPNRHPDGIHVKPENIDEADVAQTPSLSESGLLSDSENIERSGNIKKNNLWHNSDASMDSDLLELEQLLEVVGAERDVRYAEKALADCRVKETIVRTRLFQIRAAIAAKKTKAADRHVGRARLMVNRAYRAAWSNGTMSRHSAPPSLRPASPFQMAHRQDCDGTPSPDSHHDHHDLLDATSGTSIYAAHFPDGECLTIQLD